jgi:hypothetical protein
LIEINMKIPKHKSPPKSVPGVQQQKVNLKKSVLDAKTNDQDLIAEARKPVGPRQTCADIQAAQPTQEGTATIPPDVLAKRGRTGPRQTCADKEAFEALKRTAKPTPE